MMIDNVVIIGGADGPTEIFMAENLGSNWFNIFGMIIVILMLIPNCIYALKNKNQKNLCQNKFMNIVEQIGRYGCIILMIFSIGIKEFGYSSIEAFLIYILGNAILLLIYWIVWGLYFHKECFWKKMILAVTPACIFLLSGITLQYYLLILFAIIFACGHIYVTIANDGKRN